MIFVTNSSENEPVHEVLKSQQQTLRQSGSLSKQMSP